MRRRSRFATKQKQQQRQGVFADSARRRKRERTRQQLRRVFAQEEGEEEKVQPGGVSGTLKRRMGDEIAEMFDDAGKELYKETVESLKDVLTEQFERSIPALDESLKAEGGRRWQKKASEFYRPWINEMVETIITQGMNEASGALEDVASSYAAEHAVVDEDGKEELLEVPVEETEEVEEVEPEETEGAEEEEEGTEEEGGEEEGGKGETTLEELFASQFPRRKRSQPHRRRVIARQRRMGPDRVYDEDVEYSLKPLREVEEGQRRNRGLPVLEEEEVVEMEEAPRGRSRRRNRGRNANARQRSWHSRRFLAGTRGLDIPEIVWNEIEHYIPDGWEENFAPHLEREGNTIIGDEALIQEVLGELEYIAEMRCGNENYPAWENVEVIEAIGGVFRDAGQEEPSWFATCEDYEAPDEPDYYLSMEPGNARLDLNLRGRAFRGR